MDNKLVFLAGSTGSVGSSILKFLLDNYPTTRIRAIYYKQPEPFIKHDRIEYFHADLKSAEDCRTYAKGCDCAIMAAAFTGGAELLRTYGWKYVNENLFMNAQMLEAFHFENVKRVVFIGSATLYQEFEGEISEEGLDLNKEPHSSYLGFGWVIRFIEKLCKFWHQNYNMEVITVRASNIFGPFSKFDQKTSNFIPALIRKAADKMDPYEIWGSPDVIRDVIYSEDFAKAIVMLLEAENIKYDTFNIGSGIKTKVGDVAEWALKYADHNPNEIKYIQDKPVTIKFRALDCSKIKKSINWEPEHSIEQGIEKTVNWWLKNKDWWRS
ncbi:NAD-dependent epimerase/dehydratase family protein [candidate division KSB1 bacterium]